MLVGNEGIGKDQLFVWYDVQKYVQIFELFFGGIVYDGKEFIVGLQVDLCI